MNTPAKKDAKQPEVRFEQCGSVLKDLRTKNGMGLRGFSELAGCSYSQLAKLEKNQQTIPLSMILKLAKELRVPAGALIVKCFEAAYPEMMKTKTGRAVAEISNFLGD